MKKTVWGFFLLLLFGLSYSREVLFLSINSIISGETTFYARTIKIPWLLQQPVDFLVHLKFILTITYSLLFALTTIFGLKFSFKEKLPLRLSLFTYSTLFTIAGLALIIVYLTNSFNNAYPYFRHVIEYLHTPLIFLFLSVSNFVIRNTRNEH